MYSAKLKGIFELLYGSYGPQRWWPAETRFEMIVGAILTQSVAWSNVEKAIANLKNAGVLDPAKMLALPDDELALMIRSSGYYRVKARKIKAFLEHLREHYQYDLDQFLSSSVKALRDELLSIYGMGPETADSIVLYAAFKPVFVVDAYTKRLLHRLGLASSDATYESVQSIFHDNLPLDTELFQEYHALIVQVGKSTCQKKPRCASCPLSSMCSFHDEG